MKLDQLLGSKTVEQLQDMLMFWAPEQALSNSKMELFRALRMEMVRPNRVERCLDKIGSLQRGVIRKLLRSEHLGQTVNVLAASSAARPKSIEETQVAVNQLAMNGLVCVEPAKRWETFGSARVALPEELVEPLRKATGIDNRRWREILNLADHLAARPPEALAEALEPAGVDPQEPVEDLAAALARHACANRFSGLSEPLCDLVRRAIEEKAGLVPIGRLPRMAEGLPELDDEVLGRWRAELESNFVGTIGDLSLLDFGIDLDGKVLSVFTEVVETRLPHPLEHAAEPPDPVGPDFLLDLAELVQCARESVARLKMSGALTAPASDRIIARMNRPELPLMGAYELLELRVACAERLGLVERTGDILAAKRSAWDWEQRSYEDQANSLFDLIGFVIPFPQSEHHHAGLCGAASEVLREMAPAEWRRTGSVAGLALRRYLVGLGGSGLRQTIARAVEKVSEYVLPPFPGLMQLTDIIDRAVVMGAYAMGFIDISEEGGRPVAVRVSEFGMVGTGAARPAERKPGKLIVTPDFEVILLPEGDTTRLRYEVGQFARHEKVEQTYHLRIGKDRVERAVVHGLDADDQIGILREHAETPVPQNVEYSIRNWAKRVSVASAEEVVVFELPDERTLDVVAELPEMSDLVVRRIAPTALALRQAPNDRDLIETLRKLGVYIR